MSAFNTNFPFLSNEKKHTKEEFDQYCEKNNLFKKCWYPTDLNKRDTVNPKISKIGGKRPHLPEEELNPNHSMLMQLYIPTIPEEMKSFFPKEKQNSLLVVMIDSEIHGLDNDATIRLYSEDQLDKLVYENDVQFDGIYLNEPVTIGSWVEGIQVPSCGEIFEELEEKFGPNYETNYGILTMDQTYLGGHKHVFNDESPPSDEYVLFMNFGQGKASSDLWGDCGTGQLYMTVGNNFGAFYFTHSE
ncbi:hypothetical protein GPJ56_000796 [Histomonas meleagridis]|uniref:uncharacterized protein n=1 Tax=Histomonas meleagridis TaxID=135588 RepID=UPI00355A4271|nr:hypothetical protein GPJ56_000796 [Histomonas meleagridis]KAH0804445.1 hypothetical protein GO595_003275 [Histomonas meleagridis]